MRSPRTDRVAVAAGLCLVALAAHAGTRQGPAKVTLTGAAADHLASARAPFIENQGQLADAEVRFYARTLAGRTFVTASSQLVYALPVRDRERAALWAFRESFAGRRPTSPKGDTPSSVRVSLYRGDDPSAWKPRLGTFDTVDLGELYPGIRVELKAAGNTVEKLFHVAPGGEVEAIDIAIEGVDSLDLDPHGRLVLETSLGDILFTAPLAYQEVDGVRVPVEVAYALGEDQHYGFRVGDYDRELPLVIDPLLASTYLGGHNPDPPGNYDDDFIHGVVAAGDSVYVAGVTQSPDFPIHLGYDDTLPNAYPDGFITRMSADLTRVLASTYFGTEGFDRVTDLAVEDSGTVVVVGQAGWGFPVTDGAYTWSGSTPVGGGFVSRFSADLSTLLGSAVPTPGDDYPAAVALASDGIYFGGTTDSSAFPITPGAYLSTCCPVGPFGIPEHDGFAGKLSLDLTSLEAMTYLGGDTVSGIAVVSDGNVFITDGFDHAVTGSIARFDAGLTDRTAYLSYYPGSTSGSSRTYFNDVAVTADGHVVAAGQTYMNDLPATPGAFDTTCGTDGLCDGVGPLLVPRSDGFVAIYSQDLQSTLALTYLGGSNHESIRAVDLASDGSIVLTGETVSVDLPTVGAGADTDCGTDGACDPAGPFNSPTPDGFVARLTADLSQLAYGSYLGGSGEDRPLDIDVDENGVVSVGGFTRSVDFPTTAGAFDSTYNGGTSDAFISRFDAGISGGLIFADDFESGTLSLWD